MPILTQELEVIPIGITIKHYKDLGYDAKHKQPLLVKVDDLPPSSGEKVEILCDMCNKNTMYVRYADYNKIIKDTGSYVCSECRTKKRSLTSMEKYGTSHPMQNAVIKNKSKKTCLERYGVDHYTKTTECQEKMKKTCEERYGENYTKVISEKSRNSFYEKTGYEYVSQSPEIREKIKQTCIDKYGVQNPSQSAKIQEKKVQTFLEKYGVENPNKLPEIREKTAKTLYKNSSQKASKQQRYICRLFSGILNFPIKYYNVDIYIQKDGLIVEYDGGFHMGNIIMGRETQEDFERKEIIRNNIIKREGYKQMKIISSKDYLPSDEILLQMLSHAKKYFLNYPNHSWIEFNIDTSTVRNAEQKEGSFFDYGELRKIKSNLEKGGN